MVGILKMMVLPMGTIFAANAGTVIAAISNTTKTIVIIFLISYSFTHG
jgi:hypothetical protein